MILDGWVKKSILVERIENRKTKNSRSKWSEIERSNFFTEWSQAAGLVAIHAALIADECRLRNFS